MDIYSYASHYENLLNQMPSFLILTTLDHKIAFVNDKTAKVLGFKSLDEAVGISIYNVRSKSSEDSEYFKNQNEIVFTQSKKIATLGYHHYVNSWAFNLSEKNPLLNHDGIPIGVITNWIDTTNYKIIDLSRFLYNSSKQFNHIEKKSFSYLIEDGSINQYKLSERQIECLFFLLRGRSVKEIGNILRLSPRTVEGYINEIKYKMDCPTKSQLIEKSFSEGLFYLIPKKLI